MIEKLVNEQEEFNEKAIKNLSLKEVTQDIYKDIEEYLLKTSNINANNVLYIEKIVFDLLNKSNYKGKINKFLDKVKNSGQNEFDINKKLGNKVSDRVAKRIINNGILFNIENALLEDGIRYNVTSNIQKEVFNAILLKKSVPELLNNIKNIIVGNNAKSGILQRYAEQVAKDGLLGYQREINLGISKELKLDHTLYTPKVILENTRPICRYLIEEKGGRISNEELQKIITKYMNDEQLSKGMNENTKTINDFYVYAGGYNCNHKCYATL